MTALPAGTDDALLLACGRHALSAEVARGFSHAGIAQGARVLIAASGGVDSTALLALSAGLARSGRLVPVAAHVDHGLRPGSAAEGDAVEALSARLGVPCLRRTLALPLGAALADRARTARYAALADAASQARCHFVATAHHADDQLETILLAIARGAGLHGLAGMPARRASADGPIILRPCLRICAAALRQACIALGLSWCEDPGNARMESPRGRMRHVVLPALEAVSPGAAQRAALAAEVARLGDALLESHVRSLMAPDGSVPRRALAGAPASLAATALWLMAGERLSHADRWRAAEAATDESTEPRRFTLAQSSDHPASVLLVDAHAVRIEGSQGNSSEARRQRV